MNSAAQGKQNSPKDCNKGSNCQFNKFRRPLYYHGMLIDEKGFRDEQEYHAQKRRLINRLVHGAGVVCGLNLTKQDERTFTIGCGLVFDCGGWEIYVPSDVTVPVPQPSSDPASPCGPATAGKEICYRIRIAFTDEDTDYQQVQLPGGACGDKTCKPARKREGFCIDLHVCECLQARTPFDCKDAGWNIDYVRCSCGCECSCGEDHWVSIGTVRVTDGKITGGPTYECRDYVISGQMLKQLLSKPNAEEGDCSCPDQFERLKDILGLICKTNTRTQETATGVVVLVQKETQERDAQGKALEDKIKATAAAQQDLMDLFRRSEAQGKAALEEMNARVANLETASKRGVTLEKKAKPKPEEPPEEKPDDSTKG